MTTAKQDLEYIQKWENILETSREFITQYPDKSSIDYIYHDAKIRVALRALKRRRSEMAEKIGNKKGII